MPEVAVPRVLVVHHSAGLGDFEAIERAHVEGNGWRAIGYNLVVERDASVRVGRPIPEKPAANSGANDYTLAVCLVGNNASGDPAEHWRRQQVRRLRRIVKSALTLWPDVVVVGHRDLPWAATECPGLDVRELLRLPSLDDEELAVLANLDLAA